MAVDTVVFSSNSYDSNTMMMLIHLIMLGFLVGAGLCVAHFGMRLWAESRDVNCPMGKLARASSHTLRVGAMGLGAYVLASVSWVAIPAALTGFFLARPALKPALAPANATSAKPGS